MKVLIADDNPMWTQLLSKTVARCDFEPITVSNGKEAMQALSVTDPPRIVFLDWQMPEMNGLEACRAIKLEEQRPFTYVVMLTSRDANEDMIAGLEAGADDYLTKPVDAAVIRSRLMAAKRIIEAIPPPEWTRPKIEGYELKQLIGKGAFATVWEAIEGKTGQRMALKVIRVDLATEQVFHRFAHEIEMMRRMDHVNVAHVYDAEVSNQCGYIAMELVDGLTLDKYVYTEKPSPLEIIQLTIDVCEGLHHVHNHGVVHRDLKPSNIMVNDQGRAKILDFGLCKSMFDAAGDRGSSQSDAPNDLDESTKGLVIGSPLFMAPEQASAKNQKIDARCDIYALGVILYMALLRRHPIVDSDDNRSATIREMARGKAHAPSQLNPQFSKSLERILMKSLARNPDDRYQTAASFADDLREFLQRRKKK